MVELLTKEEKERILKTLEEDREFRYAVAGVIGLVEILKKLDLIEARIEEHSKKLEDHSKRIEELAMRIVEHSRVLQDHSKRIEELVRVVGELKTAVGSLGRRIGLDLEKAILNLYKDVLLGLGIKDINKIEKFTYRDFEGRYFKRGARIEIDVYVHNEEAYLIEVKSLLEEEDVDWFDKKCEIVASLINKSVRRKIIVAVNTTKDALERARELNIDVIYGTLIE